MSLSSDLLCTLFRYVRALAGGTEITWRRGQPISSCLGRDSPCWPGGACRGADGLRGRAPRVPTRQRTRDRNLWRTLPALCRCRDRWCGCAVATRSSPCTPASQREHCKRGRDCDSHHLSRGEGSVKRRRQQGAGVEVTLVGRAAVVVGAGGSIPRWGGRGSARGLQGEPRLLLASVSPLLVRPFGRAARAVARVVPCWTFPVRALRAADRGCPPPPPHRHVLQRLPHGRQASSLPR